MVKKNTQGFPKIHKVKKTRLSVRCFQQDMPGFRGETKRATNDKMTYLQQPGARKLKITVPCSKSRYLSFPRFTKTQGLKTMSTFRCYFSSLQKLPGIAPADVNFRFKKSSASDMVLGLKQGRESDTR